MCGYGECLRKSSFFLLIVGLLLVSGNLSSAQVFPIASGLGLDFGIIKITPFAQAGYKSFGFSLNLPIPSDEGFFFAPPALDLKFRDAKVGVGSVGLDARVPAGLFITLKAEGTTTKNIDVIAGQNIILAGQPTPYTWTGSSFQWWDVDGLVGFNCFRDWSVVVGLRYDKLTVGLRNPIDATGTALGVPLFLPGETFSFSGDLLVKTWTPYFGLQLKTPAYRASLLYSPWASPDVIVPQRLFDFLPNFPIAPFFVNETADIQWKFSKMGQFLEACAEYDFPLLDNLKLGFWVKGTWMGFRGNGTWSFNDRTLISFVPSDVQTIFNQNADSSLYRYEFAGGLTAFCDF